MVISNASEPVTFSLDGDGVGWITFDAPGARANVFNPATLCALAAAIDAAEASAAAALVVTGAKERIFIAGADLRWLQRLPDATAAEALSAEGQRLFDRLTRFRGPVVAAVHGACAGGGFELALACDWRIASEAAVTQLGLPETSIGAIPGWGGCVRLPRLVGAQAALEHIVRGRLVEAGAALEAGLVDAVVPVGELNDRAKAAALGLLKAGRPRRVPPPQPPAAFYGTLREAVRARTHGHQPAPLAAIDLVAGSIGLPLAEAMAVEARAFGEVTAGAVCKNLIQVFFLRDTAKKRTLDGWFTDQPCGAAGAPIRRVGVVGAGVMGSGIAHWLATRGFDVVLRDVQLEFVERALGVIRALIDDGVKRGTTSADEAGVVFGRIRTTTTWDGFADCDLVVEAIVENVAAKQQLFSELAAVVRPDTLLASNTSALPIEDIAGHVPGPERTVGIHFFNPVSRMPLVELIMAPRTSVDAAGRVMELVRSLGKSPVVCRSSPGFLVTRVLFFYLNAAVRCWERGEDAAVIDAELRGFGWPMGPLRLIDEVGIDVTAFIFGEMAHYFPGRFAATRACDALLAAGLKGRKNGAGRGFYRYGGAGPETTNEAEARALVLSGTPLPPEPAAEYPVDRIAHDLMKVMVEEARRCLAERVVLSPDDVDFALLSGAGFPAFRGGLLRWAEAVGM